MLFVFYAFQELKKLINVILDFLLNQITLPLRNLVQPLQQSHHIFVGFLVLIIHV